MRDWNIGQPDPNITTVESGVFTIGPGVELTDFGFRSELPPLPALVDVDVSDTQILVTLVINQPSSDLERFNFIDAGNSIPIIRNVKLNSASTWDGFDAFGRILPNPNGVTIQAGGLSGLQGQFLLLDVIPEPGCVALMATCALGIVAVRRRNARRA